MAYVDIWGIVERGLKKSAYTGKNKRPKNLVRNKCQNGKDKHSMKKVTLSLSLALTALTFVGCAAFTKGVNTARATVLGAINTVESAVDTGFNALTKGAETAEKIAEAANTGAKETVGTAVDSTSNAAP